MSVNTYHGYFAYNFGGSDAKVVPYVLGGFGATSYGGVDFTRLNGADRQPLVEVTKFSSTWGFGVKAYPENTLEFVLECASRRLISSRTLKAGGATLLGVLRGRRCAVC